MVLGPACIQEVGTIGLLITALSPWPKVAPQAAAQQDMTMSRF